MSSSLKEAVLYPLLKKSSLDHELYANFRPVSNLRLLTKVTEKVAATRLIAYLQNNNLFEPFQSAYKQFHSCETALVRVQNDILRAVDNNCCVVLLLLDLSAAFDTVDHTILLNRMSSKFGIKGQESTLCSKLYIGESGRKLGDRFREHLLDVKNKGSDQSKPVARHFNLPGHSHEHMEICGIYLHLGNNETRKRKEQRLIFKLGTLAPNGINERFSFA